MAMGTYKHEHYGTVRVVIINSEPYFVGVDVLNILGYGESEQVLLNHLDIEDIVDSRVLMDSLLNSELHGACLINIFGLCSLIASSQSPSALDFKRWIAGEVLPEIRKISWYTYRAQLHTTYSSKEETCSTESCSLNELFEDDQTQYDVSMIAAEYG